MISQKASGGTQGWQQTPFVESAAPATTTMLGVRVTDAQAREIYASVPTAIEDGIVVAYPTSPEQAGALYAKISDVAALNGDHEGAERVANLAGFSRREAVQPQPQPQPAPQVLPQWDSIPAQPAPVQQPVQMLSPEDMLRSVNVVPADLAAQLTYKEYQDMEWIRGAVSQDDFKLALERLRKAHRKPTLSERIGKWFDSVAEMIEGPELPPQHQYQPEPVRAYSESDYKPTCVYPGFSSEADYWEYVHQNIERNSNPNPLPNAYW